VHGFCLNIEKSVIMKTTQKISAPLALLFSAFLWQSCSDAPRGDNATITDKQQAANATGQTFVVDTTASKMRFTGHGVGKNHKGTLRLSSGEVAIANKQLTGGNFIINIRSLDLDEKGGIFDEKLRPHLMSGDFFDAEKFGSAKFVITDVKPYQSNGTDTSIVEGANFTVSGNFTLKDVTKNITFPARIDLDDNTLKAKGNFDIDRRQWNMNFGNDKTLGDKFISEKVNIELDLEADRRQQG
jgi:polyisoprenoid-binding protein YceI